MTRSTGIHKFHIIGICPSRNNPSILHIYASLNCYCSLHIDPHYCMYQSKQQIATFIYHATVIYAPARNMSIIYQIILSESMGGGMPIYIPHMNSLAPTMWPGVLCTMTTKTMQPSLLILIWPSAKTQK